MEAGLNYLNGSPNASMLQKFKSDGLVLSVRLYWNQLEKTRGSYSLSTYRSLFDACESLGLKVNVTFWNQLQSGAEIPSFYKTSNYAIVENAEAQAAWLKMMAWTAQQLSSYACIDSWCTNNEPYYSTTAQKNGWISLFPLEVAAIKQYDSRPVLCRFTLSYTPASGKYPDSVYSVFDAWGITIYCNPANYDNPNDPYAYNARWFMYKDTIMDCASRGLPVWIMEFGASTNPTSLTEEQKRVWIRDALAIFAADGVVTAYAWSIRYDDSNFQNEAWNFWNGSRLISAYDELVQYDNGEPLPPPEEPPNVTVPNLSGAWGPYTGDGRAEPGVYSPYTPEGAWLSYNAYWVKRAANNPIGSTCRLAFNFYPVAGYPTIDLFTFEKMDRVLEIFSEYGCLVIFDCHQGDQSCLDANLLPKWQEVAAYYKGDSRIAAFNLFNEPRGSLSEIANYYKTIARAIWAIDPQRIVILPMLQLADGSNASACIAAYADIVTDPRAVIDIAHCYYFENQYDINLNVEQKVEWYRVNWIQPFVDAWGPHKCWIGETYLWQQGTLAKQTEWLVRFTVLVGSLLVPMQAVVLWGNGTTVANEDAALGGYIPPASNIQFTVQAGEGGEVNLPGIHVYPVDSMQTFIATPNTGYVFDQWVLTGVGETVHDKYNSTVTLQMIREVDGATLTATFKAVQSPSKSGLGTYYLLPPKLLGWLYKLRTRFISEEQHRKLHPLI